MVGMQLSMTLSMTADPSASAFWCSEPCLVNELLFNEQLERDSNLPASTSWVLELEVCLALYTVLGVKPRTSCLPNKQPIMELHQAS